MLFEKLNKKECTYEEVPLESIIIEDEEKIKPPAFLKKNIKKFGVIHTVLLYRNNDGKYHVLAGRKRILSLKGSRIKTVPARVFSEKPSETEIALILLSENLVRKPSPAQEAKQIKRLIDSGCSVEEIHKTTGIPVRVIKQRLKLLNLTSEWFEKLEKGEITLSKALKIARLPEIEQEKLLKEKDKTIKEIENRVKAELLKPLNELQLDWTVTEEKSQNGIPGLTEFLTKNNIYCQVTFIPKRKTFVTIMGTKNKKVTAEDRDIAASIAKAIESIKKQESK